MLSLLRAANLVRRLVTHLLDLWQLVKASMTRDVIGAAMGLQAVASRSANQASLLWWQARPGYFHSRKDVEANHRSCTMQ